MDEYKLNNFYIHKFSTSSPGTEGEGGTGLGLSMCKDFLDFHNGKIEIKSKLDKGTKVTVTIPL